MAREYRQRTAEQKVAILREVLLEKQPISKVCEEHDLSPTLFYEGQKQFFEHGAAAFAKDRDGQKRQFEKRVEDLEAKLAQGRRHRRGDELGEL